MAMAEDEQRCESLEFLPENLRNSLLDFQKEGVKFAIRNQGRCLIGDEMGLGKTLQALSIAYYYKDEWPLLVVVPSSVKYPWIEEIEKWLTDLEPGDINLIRSGTDISNIPSSKISILGYGLCCDQRSSKLLVNALKEQAFKVVVLDESHYLKNRTAARTKLLHPIGKSATRTILLTGTPSLARPEELYMQLDMVCPGKFGSFSSFATRYCEAHYEFFGKFRKWNTRGACNLDELHKRLQNGIMIRRLKKNVLTQLPPKRRQKITFDMPDSDHKQDLFQAKAEFKQHRQILSNKEAVTQQKTQALFELNRLSTVLYHYTGLAKAGSVQQYISDLLDGMENKFIVFCRHKQVITAVIQRLAKKNARYICIDGSVPSAARGSLVKQFQTNPLVRVAVLSIEAASFGLTLTAADHVVFAELHFTPGVMMQAEDRAHRIGQENAVNVHYLVARGTLDEVLWGMLRRKIYVTSSALDGKLDELHAEDGDEETAKQLSICEAWLNDESEESDATDYLFSQTRKVNKQIQGQQDLRSFFTLPRKDTQETSLDSDEELMEISASLEKDYSSSSGNAASPVVTIEDNCEGEEYNNEAATLDDSTYMVDKENDNVDNFHQNTREKSEAHMVSCLEASSLDEPNVTDHCSETISKEKHALPSSPCRKECSWSCEACTFINDFQMLKCSMCLTRKPQIMSSLVQLSNKCSSQSKSLSSKAASRIQMPNQKQLAEDINDKNTETQKKITKMPRREIIEIDDEDLDDFTSPFSKWSCSTCTFLNDPMLIECSMCMTPKRRSKRNTNSRWSTKSCEKRERKKQSLSGKRKRIKTEEDNSSTVSEGVVVTNTEHEVNHPALVFEKITPSRKRLQLEKHSFSLSDESSLKLTDNRTLGDNSKKTMANEPLSKDEETSTNEVQPNNGGLLQNSKKENDDSKQSQNLFLLELSDSDSTEDKNTEPFETRKELSTNVQHILDVLSTPNSCLKPLEDAEESRKNMNECIDKPVISAKELAKGLNSSISDFEISSEQNNCSEELQQIAEEIFAEDSDMEDVGEIKSINYYEKSSRTHNLDTASSLLSSSQISSCSPSLSKCSNNHLESSEVPTEVGEVEFNESSMEKKPRDPPEPISLKFSLSAYTDRVYLYNKNEQFLKCNFLMSDLGNQNREDLPFILQLDHNFKQAKRMLQIYQRLGVVKKRMLSKSKLVFQDPIDAYQLCRGIKESSKVRHTTKDQLVKNVKETARTIGGEVRIVTKSPDRKRPERKASSESSSPKDLRKPTEGRNTSSKEEVSCLQAFGPEGTPICMFCRAPVDYGALGNDWDCRFCSFDCKENFQIRISNSALRNKLFDAEQGICQQCHFDAHACYNNVKALPKKDRRAFLEKSIYANLSSRLLNRMILEPKEGMFWEADHIVAVAEGGGECGLENLRTLCVPCHKKETKDLLTRLKTKRQQTDTTGSMSISKFLEPKK